MNSNFFHNLLNLAGLLVGSIATFDWTGLGLSPAVALEISGGTLIASSAIKLAVNVSRDGLAGLTKPQPPVQ